MCTYALIEGETRNQRGNRHRGIGQYFAQRPGGFLVTAPTAPSRTELSGTGINSRSTSVVWVGAQRAGRDAEGGAVRNPRFAAGVAVGHAVADQEVRDQHGPAPICLRRRHTVINAVPLELSRSQSSQIYRSRPDTFRVAGKTCGEEEDNSVGRRQLHLNAFLMSPGHHEASWRLTESDPLAATDVATTRTSPGLLNAARSTRSSSRTNRSSTATSAVDRSAFLEPLTLLTVLAGVTERIGLIATASTSYNSPYNLARRFASLDHVSNGRAGWNIVTTATLDAARNFGLAELPSHSARYARAAEFVDVTQKLWDSWEDDTIVADKRAGVWGDQAKIHAPEHHGEYFSVQGALNIPRSPQGYPLLVQAGSSEDGKALAARYAEAVFTAQQTTEEARRGWSVRPPMSLPPW
ncbi:MAG: hypothetical protein QOI01_4279 [Mycobacterium sp.]|jgi:hypothetical protein|nr:hypothetical protein [Mycobacterium sp.]